MKISGFTIVRNALKYHYPAVEAIRAILPICDEFIINVGDSGDDTLGIMQSLQSSDGDKVRIIRNTWDFSQGKTVLSHQTNLALKECRGDWAFYVQSDEIIHEADLPKLKRLMKRYLHDENVDALRFSWMHFYGSYFRYRVDRGWFQKQDRIIRNNGQIESIEDAFGFARKDRQPLKRKHTGCLLYHYGWVHSEEMMTERRVNAEKIGFTTLQESERREKYSYGDLNRFPAYFGAHPRVMQERIAAHTLSQRDLADIRLRHRWHPLRLMNLRYKTWQRVKERIE